MAGGGGINPGTTDPVRTTREDMENTRAIHVTTEAAGATCLPAKQLTGMPGARGAGRGRKDPPLELLEETALPARDSDFWPQSCEGTDFCCEARLWQPQKRGRRLIWKSPPNWTSRVCICYIRSPAQGSPGGAVEMAWFMSRLPVHSHALGPWPRPLGAARPSRLRRLCPPLA